MSQLNQYLAKHGICHLEPLFRPEEIQAINRMVDPLFAARADLPRSYVYSDEIGSSGLLPLVLSPRVRDCLFTIMPDAVLYHMHIYEIAANQTQPHIFSELMAGWHRDPDSANGRKETTHASVFIYLTDVGEEDGPFQFIPQHPVSWLHKNTPYVSMVGAAGTSFAWDRSFYHRASPNRGNVRRRLLKFSVQNNRFTSEHLANEHFRALIAATPEGDQQLDLLLGRYQGKPAPLQKPNQSQAFQPVIPQHRLSLGNRYLAKWQIRLVVRAVKRRLKGMRAKEAAYD